MTCDDVVEFDRAGIAVRATGTARRFNLIGIEIENVAELRALSRFNTGKVPSEKHLI